MKRIQVYLEDSTIDALNEFSQEKSVSVSSSAANIIREYFQGGLPSLNDNEMKAYFLRTINTMNQVLMCVYDENKTSVDSGSAKECIEKITQQFQIGLGIDQK